MRREPILLIWIGGLVLAALIYVAGPDQFFSAVINFLNSIEDFVRQIGATLGAQAYGVIRALAIAFYFVFAVLSFLSSQRHHRGIGALIAVSIVFLLLVWRPYADDPAPMGRWLAALIVVFAGSVVMTQRLVANPLRRDIPPPYPPGRVP